jgi:AcrR family transcriptional regulator
MSDVRETCQPETSAPIGADDVVEWEDARHLRSRERILAAATRTLSSNPRASLADIAREADVGRTTLHRYFPTRLVLQEAMTERALARLDAVFDRVDFEQPLAVALTQLVTECLPLGPEMVLVGNNPDWWEGDWGGRYERYSSTIAQAIERAQEQGEARNGVPPWWAAELVMLNLWGGWYVVSGGYVGPKAMPGLIMDTLLHGLAP